MPHVLPASYGEVILWLGLFLLPRANPTNEVVSKIISRRSSRHSHTIPHHADYFYRVRIPRFQSVTLEFFACCAFLAHVDQGVILQQTSFD